MPPPRSVARTCSKKGLDVSSYTPITQGVLIRIGSAEYGPQDYPHLARAFDIHTRLIIKHCKAQEVNLYAHHRIVLNCAADRFLKPILISADALWQASEKALFWEETHLHSHDYVSALSYFRDALQKTPFSPVTAPLHIDIKGCLAQLSDHDILRLEAL